MEAGIRSLRHDRHSQQPDSAGQGPDNQLFRGPVHQEQEPDTKNREPRSHTHPAADRVADPLRDGAPGTDSCLRIILAVALYCADVILYCTLWALEWLLPPYDTAYRDIALERECYDNQADQMYLKRRKWFAWVKYLFKRPVK